MNSDQIALVGQVFESYVSEYHKNDILLILKENDEDAHYPVVVNAMTLFETNMEIGEYFNAFPNEVLTIFDNSLRRSAMTILESLSQPEGVSMKQNLHARISGLPVCPELVREHIPKTKDVGHFLSVTGTVIRTSLVKILEFERDYMCNKCKHVFVVKADFEQYYTFCRPSSCPSLESCDSSKFTCLSDLSSSPTKCRDYQEIKIQEQVQRLAIGNIPRSMKVILEDDLVDTCKSGDDLTIYGVVMQRWKPFQRDVRCEVEIVLKANYVQVNNEQSAGIIMDEEVRKEFEDFWEHYKSDPFAGRNEILASLCPQVFGMYLVKLAVAMVLAGGIQRTDATGTRVRERRLQSLGTEFRWSGEPVPASGRRASEHPGAGGECGPGPPRPGARSLRPPPPLVGRGSEKSARGQPRSPPHRGRPWPPGRAGNSSVSSTQGLALPRGRKVGRRRRVRHPRRGGVVTPGRWPDPLLGVRWLRCELAGATTDAPLPSRPSRRGRGDRQGRSRRGASPAGPPAGAAGASAGLASRRPPDKADNMATSAPTSSEQVERRQAPGHGERLPRPGGRRPSTSSFPPEPSPQPARRSAPPPSRGRARETFNVCSRN
ncbi:DNA helicase MCM9 isoform X7 [Myotis myotis]|uniref:DNA helicase MCM9 isoform X7 n=1 Tax=Myotis myotis TaxID=51298 RepID=UPI00174DA0C8|nr:DNA helicase MCM9 isoform X7 [Myotis myotis]